MSGKPPPLHIRRVIVTCVALVALLLCPLPASGGAMWDIAAIVGYAATIFALVLYLYPLRGRGIGGDSLPHRRLFTVSQHRRFGWIALGLAGLHTAIILIVQPLTAHYLLPSAPLYMLCGLGALIALAILVPTGLSTRTSMRRSPSRRLVGISHAAVASLFLGLLGAHLVGSGQLVDTTPKVITASVLLAAPLIWSVIRSRQEPLRGGYWAALCVALISGAVLLLLPIRSTTARLMEPTAMRPGVLPVRFPHEMHTTVDCVTCHHNFHDRTGSGNCIDCHRSQRTDLTRSSESTFHTFCRDCHRELALEGHRHGPTRACQPCHRN